MSLQHYEYGTTGLTLANPIDLRLRWITDATTYPIQVKTLGGRACVIQVRIHIHMLSHHLYAYAYGLTCIGAWHHNRG